MGRSLARPTWDLPGVETLIKLEDLLHKVRCRVEYMPYRLNTCSTQRLTIALTHRWVGAAAEVPHGGKAGGVHQDHIKGL